MVTEILLAAVANTSATQNNFDIGDLTGIRALLRLP
jgi:hypothetical protein